MNNETVTGFQLPCRARTGLQASTVQQASSKLPEFPASPPAGTTRVRVNSCVASLALSQKKSLHNLFFLGHQVDYPDFRSFRAGTQIVIVDWPG